MDYKSIYYPESRFGGFTNIDGTVAFFTRIHALVNPSSVVLDIGCGRGAHSEDPVAVRKNLRIFKGKCEKVIGIDVDSRAKENPFLDEFFLLDGKRWPLEDESVDVGVCDFVLEHVEDPDAFFSECRRVIRPGGYLCIRTPNALGYVALFSKLIPNRHHASVVSKVQDRRKGEDVFPTYYRCNTKGKITRTLDQHGFDGCVIRYDAEPSYASFSRLAYRLGVLHQRHVPDVFKTTLFAFAQKRNQGS